MMFRCPVCGERHVVPDNYDNSDYMCPNGSNRISRKVFNDVVPNDLLTKNNFTMNRRSTKVDEARAVPIEVHAPGFRRDGTKIGTLDKTNY
jgi:hypothetical protein